MKKLAYQKEKDSGEQGFMMLEAMIVYMVTVFLLFFILALFCVFYHIWSMQTVANEAAARVAQTCKFTDADIDTGYVTKEQVTGLERYRYVSGKAESMQLVAQEKLEAYINRRLDRVSFVHKIASPEIRVEIKKDGMASRHVEVYISEKFRVPFGGALTYFGYNDTIHYECTAYAEFLDLIDYVNTVDFVSQQTSLGHFGSTTISLVNAVLKLFHNIFD